MRYLSVDETSETRLEFIPSPEVSSRTFSGLQLARWTERYAATLHRRGLRAGDRVALHLPNSPELVVALLGNHLLGIVTVPVASAATMKELEYVADRAEISGLVGSNPYPGRVGMQLLKEEFWAILQEQGGGFPEAEDPEAPALLCFTSGTTARPKGVLLTHRNIRSNLQDLIQVWQWSREDRLLLTLPLFHVHGLVVALHGWAMTGCQAILTRKFDPTHVLDLLTQRRCTLFMGVPTMYHRMVSAFDRRVHSFANLRLAISGSAPMSVELHRKCREVTGQTILERYGMTETIMNTSNPFHARLPGSVGLPLPSVQLRLIDDQTREIREDKQIGEVCVRGPNVFGGYWKDPEATSKAFLGDWLRTGDAGYRDKNGYYHLVGRLSVDLIKSGGYRIGSREVEDVLERHPAVREVAVVGLPDPDLGEKVAAFVVTDGTASREDLAAHCRSALALFKCPRLFVVVDSLPRNAMGKVTKSVLETTPHDGSA